MRLMGWLDEAWMTVETYVKMRFSTPSVDEAHLPPLPMSPEAERAVQKALAGIRMDAWADTMMKTVDLYPAPEPWATASAEQILADIKRYQRWSTYPYIAPRIYQDDPPARVTPMREEYAESLLRDTLNSRPFRIQDLSGF